MKAGLLRYILLCFALSISVFGYSQTITCTNNTGFTTSSTLRNGMSAVTVYGVSMTVSSNLTLGTLQFANTNGGANGYFSNGKLYVSTSGTRATATPVSGASVAINGGDITITGFSQAMSTGNTYTYYLDLDVTITYGSLPSTIAFSTAFVKGPGYYPSYTQSGSATGATYNLAKPDVSVSNLTTGLTTGTLVNGQTDIVIFGFSVTVTGSLTANKFTVTSATNAQSLFGSAKLWRSTTSTSYPTGFTQVATGTVNSGYTQFNYTENFPGAATTVNYFITVDYTGTCPSVSTVGYAISPTQSPAFIIGPSSVNYASSTTVTGTVFNVAKTLNWVGGQTGGLWSNLNNFATICGGAPSAIGNYDVIQIGVSSSYTSYNQPVLTGNTTVGQIIFGKYGSPNLSMGTNSLNAGISTSNVGTGSTPKITAVSGAITMPSGSVSTIAASTTLTSGAAITNNTDMQIEAGATLSLTNAVTSLTDGGTISNAGTLSASGPSTNSGTLTQSGSGTTTFSSTLNNSGTVDLQGTGVFTTSGALTNSGTISHSSSGNVSLAAITNNSPGNITFGSGTNSISGAVSMAIGASLTTAGTTTFTSGVTNNGTLNGGGTTTYSSTLGTGSGSTTTMAGTNTFNGLITNAGTFSGGTGSNTYTAGVTNNGTFNGGTGSNTFNTTAFSNSTTGTFDSGTATNDFNIAFSNSKTVTFSGGNTNFSSTFTNTSPGTVSSSAGTVTFDGTNQTISNSTTGTPVNFYNLTLANSGTKTLSGTGSFSTGGALTINSGVTLTYAAGNASNLTVTGAATNNGTYTHNSTGALTIGGILTNNASKTITLGTTTTTLNGDVSNSGTITQGTGGFDFNGSTFTNATGATFTITSGANTFGGTSFNNTGTFTVGTGTITFDGTGTTSISTTPALTFNNLTFSNGGTKTLTSGSFNISNTGTLTMSGSTTLNANGNLTLKSASTGSALVAAIPTGASITGNVNVERFFTGGSVTTQRAYRLISFPVNSNSITNNTGATAKYNLAGLSYLFTGGPGGTANGFTVPNAGTSTVFLYSEAYATNKSSFNSGNYKGIATLNADPFSVSTLTGTYSLYSGGGLMVFYAGSKNGAFSTKTNNVYPNPDNTTMVSTGTLNQGDIPVKLWYNNSTNFTWTNLGTANANDIGFVLVGNPYASTIDLAKFTKGAAASDPKTGIYGSSNLDGSIYIYDYSVKHYYAYQTSGTSGVAGTSQGGNAGRYVTSGQGFFVRATSASGTLTFHEGAKATTQVTGAALLMGVPVATNDQKQLLRVKIAQDSINKDEVAVLFDQDAKDDYENDTDVDYINGIGSVVSLSSYSKGSGKKIAINHMHSIDSLTRVKLYVSGSTTGVDTLSVSGIETLDPRYDIYLIDHYKKDSLRISQYGKYYFNINPADTNSAGSTRFELAFHKNASVSSYQLLSFTGTKVTDGIKLTWKTQNESNLTGFTIQRADGSQQFLSLYSLQSDGNGNYSYIDQAPEKGVNQYRLMQNDAFSKITYSPIVAVDAQNTTVFDGNIMLYPNPVASQLQVKVSDGLTTSTQVNLTIMSTSGQMVLSKVVDINAIDENVSKLHTGSYIVQITDVTTKKVIGSKKFIKL